MSDGGEAIGNAFTRKIGPLPAWGWGAIVIGGVWGVYLIKGKAVSTQSSADLSTMFPAGGISGAGPTPGTNDYSGVVDQLGHAGPSPQTNAQWAKQVSDSMIASGSVPADVNNAFSRYLSGQSLTPLMQSIINTAIRMFGNPPEGIVAPVTNIPSGWKGHVYTVQEGDTLDSIIQRFYGPNGNTAATKELVGGKAGLWDSVKKMWKAPTPGTVLMLGENGIAGQQNNSLNTYDTPGTSGPDMQTQPVGGSTNVRGS